MAFIKIQNSNNNALNTCYSDKLFYLLQILESN